MIKLLASAASLLLLLTPLCLQAAPRPLPKPLVEQVTDQYKGYKIAAFSDICYSDPDSLEHRGIVLQGNSENQPLRAIFAVEKDKNWTITEIPRAVKYSQGNVSDFLQDYLESPDNLRIYCVDPKRDGNINTASNGVFITKPAETTKTHVCFSADKVYNSWACYQLNVKTLKPQLSFVQLNAD